MLKHRLTPSLPGQPKQMHTINSQLNNLKSIAMEFFAMLDTVNLTQLEIMLPLFLIAVGLLTYLVIFKPKTVYLLDFFCYRAPDTHRVPIATFIEHAERLFGSETIDFQTKVAQRSGIGNETYLPSGIHLLPSDKSLNSSMEEIEMVLFTTVENLFIKHKLNPRNIDILITNCSLVCPTPSLAGLIINRFGLRSNVKSFNLSGMGCSAGLLAISLAKDLLKIHRNSTALVLSMEAVSPNIYQGKVKSMLLANCLFRMGGAAILLSNRKRDKHLAKYQLQHLVRTHLGAKDASYRCVYQEPDTEGYVGVSLSRSILHVAGDALKTNMSTLATLVLPYSEQIKYGVSILWKKLWPRGRKHGVPPYIPDFKKAFDHFCVHAGGKAVIDAIKENLRLKDRDVEASKMTLYRFGNTSSSSTWYSLSYLEAKGRVKKGDKVWQLGFGSGFKCNSVVWKCVSSDMNMMIRGGDEHDDRSFNVWSDRIDSYPVHVPNVIN